jgi:hypothetical protein
VELLTPLWQEKKFKITTDTETPEVEVAEEEVSAR